MSSFLYSASPFSGLEDLVAYSIIFSLLAIAWYVIMIIQLFLGYGTAYRLTKKGGDNGLALFGWMLVMSWAAMVPGLGFYLWKKNKNTVPPYNPYGGQPYGGQPQPYNNQYGGQPAEPLPFGIQPQPNSNPYDNQTQPNSNPYGGQPANNSNPYGGQPTDPQQFNNSYYDQSNNNPPV